MIGVSLVLRDGFLALVVLVATVILTPLAINLATRLGVVDRPAPHKFHQRPTPYLGGLAVTASVLAALIGGIFLEPQLRVQFAAIALGGAAVTAIGLADDWSPISPWPRLLVQAVAAAALFGAGVRLSPTGILGVDFAVTLFVVLAVTNSVNLLDNMDGLSAGAVAIGSSCLFVAAYWQGQRIVSLTALVLAGACLGFLPYNFSPARIFLGDAGTLFLGFLLATLVIKVNLNGYPLVTRATVPFLIIGVPLFDMTLVIWSRWRGGRPIFRGATDHSSHRLVSLGASARQAALVTYGAGLTLGGLGLALLVVRNELLTWNVVGLVAAAGLLLLWRLERTEVALSISMETKDGKEHDGLERVIWSGGSTPRPAHSPGPGQG